MCLLFKTPLYPSLMYFKNIAHPLPKLFDQEKENSYMNSVLTANFGHKIAMYR